MHTPKAPLADPSETQESVQSLEVIRGIQSTLSRASSLLSEANFQEALLLLDCIPKHTVIPFLNHLRALCYEQVNKKEEALEAAKAELLSFPQNIQVRAVFERLSREIVQRKFLRLNPEQRSFDSTLSPSQDEAIASGLKSLDYKGNSTSFTPFDQALLVQLLQEQRPRTILAFGLEAGALLWLADTLKTHQIDGTVSAVPPTLESIPPPEAAAHFSRPLLVIFGGQLETAVADSAFTALHSRLRGGEYIVVLGPRLRPLVEYLFQRFPGEYDVDNRYCDRFGYNATEARNGYLRKKQWAVNPSIANKRLISEFLRDDPAPRGITSQMSENERFQLYYALRLVIPTTSPEMRFVEIGSYEGASLRLIHAALRSQGESFRGWTIEPQGGQQFRSAVAEMAPHVTHLNKLSHQATVELRQIFESEQRFPQFIFVDGDHSFEGIRSDALDYYPLLAPAGIIAFHDYLPPLNDNNRREIFFHHGGKEPGTRRVCTEILEGEFRAELLDLPLLYPDDLTPTIPTLPQIPGVISTLRIYRKPR